MSYRDYTTTPPPAELLAAILNGADLIGEGGGLRYLLVTVDEATFDQLAVAGAENEDAEDDDPPEAVGDERDGAPCSEDDYGGDLDAELLPRVPLGRFGPWLVDGDRLRNEASAEVIPFPRRPRLRLVVGGVR